MDMLQEILATYEISAGFWVMVYLLIGLFALSFVAVFVALILRVLGRGDAGADEEGVDAGADVTSLSDVAEIITEDYRFRRSFSSAVGNLAPGDRTRYESTGSFHQNKMEELAARFNLNVVSYDGWDYDAGLPVTPLNADEFTAGDELVVQQTVEPTILTKDDGKIVKYGTVVLERKPEGNAAKEA